MKIKIIKKNKKMIKKENQDDQQENKKLITCSTNSKQDIIKIKVMGII